MIDAIDKRHRCRRSTRARTPTARRGSAGSTTRACRSPRRRRSSTWIEDGHPLGEVAEIPAPPEHRARGRRRKTARRRSRASSTSGDARSVHLLRARPEVTTPARSGSPACRSTPTIDRGRAPRGDHRGATRAPSTTRSSPQRGIGMPFDCGDGRARRRTSSSTSGRPATSRCRPAATSRCRSSRGAKLVMQIHYHPAGQIARARHDRRSTSASSTRGRSGCTSSTAFGNAFQAPSLLPGPGDDGAPRFLIPTNVADHTEHMRVTIPNLGGAHRRPAVLGEPAHAPRRHAHLGDDRAARGARQRSEDRVPRERRLELRLAAHVHVRRAARQAADDRRPATCIDVKCKWDNTMENPFVQRMLADASLPPVPIDITLGEQTTNEMCLEIFGLSIPAPPPQPPLTDVFSQRSRDEGQREHAPNGTVAPLAACVRPRAARAPS